MNKLTRITVCEVGHEYLTGGGGGGGCGEGGGGGEINAYASP